jgi:hypothetical protein
MGTFYYLLTLSNIISSLSLLGGALYFSLNFNIGSNFSIRILIGAVIGWLITGSSILFIMCLISSVEKFSTQVLYKENRVYIAPILQLLCLVSVFVCCYFGLEIQYVALFRTAPFILLLLIHNNLYYRSIRLNIKPTKDELLLSCSECLIILLDSGIVSLSYKVFSPLVAGEAGFARTCCSFGYVFYNWTLLNLRNINKYANKKFIIFILITSSATLVYIARFQTLSVVAFAFIFYFSFVPTLPLKINQFFKK